jgi:hypothetical protein
VTRVFFIRAGINNASAVYSGARGEFAIIFFICAGINNAYAVYSGARGEFAIFSIYKPFYKACIGLQKDRLAAAVHFANVCLWPKEGTPVAARLSRTLARCSLNQELID